MRYTWAEPAGRGFMLLAIMAAVFGFALNAHTTMVTNYFDEVLGFDGPQFGYITAIREVPGFLLIFITALLYRVTLQRVTAAAFVLLAVGYVFYGTATDFWTVVPWTIVSSLGFHTILQTQYALGMSLTTEARSGSILGRMNAVFQGGTFVALAMMFVLFRWDVISYRPAFVFVGLVALIGAAAVIRVPHLREGRIREAALERPPVVFRRDYRYYYALNVLDGARQQVFFSFGLWVLVNRFGMGVSQISLVLMGVTFASMASSAWLGRLIDRHGERRSLSVINLAFVVALLGFALADSMASAIAAYLLYSFIAPVAPIAASTYLRKIAPEEDIAPSLAMGVTLLHATAIVVPVVAGMILNYVGYQVPFMMAAGFAAIAIGFIRRLDPRHQRSAARVAADEAAAVRAAS